MTDEGPKRVVRPASVPGDARHDTLLATSPAGEIFS